MTACTNIEFYLVRCNLLAINFGPYITRLGIISFIINQQFLALLVLPWHLMDKIKPNCFLNSTQNKIPNSKEYRLGTSHCRQVPTQYIAVLSKHFPFLEGGRGVRQRERPVISESEAIKHISSIAARTVHGRHTCTQLTA